MINSKTLIGSNRIELTSHNDMGHTVRILVTSYISHSMHLTIMTLYRRPDCRGY